MGKGMAEGASCNLLSLAVFIIALTGGTASTLLSKVRMFVCHPVDRVKS